MQSEKLINGRLYNLALRMFACVSCRGNRTELKPNEKMRLKKKECKYWFFFIGLLWLIWSKKTLSARNDNTKKTSKV